MTRRVPALRARRGEHRAPGPASPTTDHGIPQRRRLGSVAALVAVGLGAATGTTRPGTTHDYQAVGTQAPLPQAKGPLMRLAEYIRANAPQPVGNATLVRWLIVSGSLSS